jgi:hypothetical protein
MFGHFSAPAAKDCADAKARLPKGYAPRTENLKAI